MCVCVCVPLPLNSLGLGQKSSLVAWIPLLDFANLCSPGLHLPSAPAPNSLANYGWSELWSKISGGTSSKVKTALDCFLSLSQHFNALVCWSQKAWTWALQSGRHCLLLALDSSARNLILPLYIPRAAPIHVTENCHLTMILFMERLIHEMPLWQVNFYLFIAFLKVVLNKCLEQSYLQQD